jgi:hypothetical protein
VPNPPEWSAVRTSDYGYNFCLFVCVCLLIEVELKTIQTNGISSELEVNCELRLGLVVVKDLYDNTRRFPVLRNANNRSTTEYIVKSVINWFHVIKQFSARFVLIDGFVDDLTVQLIR